VQGAMYPGLMFLSGPFIIVLLITGLGVCLALLASTKAKAPGGLKFTAWSSMMFSSLVVCLIGIRGWFVDNLATVGVVLAVTALQWFVPIAAVLILYMFYEVLTGRGWSAEFQLGLLVAGTTACFASAILGMWLMREILRCGVMWCTEDMDSVSNFTSQSMQIGFGLLSIGGGLGLTFLVVLCKLPKEPAASASLPRPLLPSLEAWQAKERQRRMVQALSGAFLAIIILPTLFVLVGMLPVGWDDMTAAEIGESLTTKYVPYSTAELSSAWMSTFSLKVTSTYYVKCFPDVVLYYGFLEVLAITSIVAAAVPAFSLWLSKPGLSMIGLSRGETMVGSMFVVMSVLFFSYWYHDHNYHESKAFMNQSATERLARTWGQTAVMYMGLLFLPASKNSLWLKALGVSWERGLWVHRQLGVLSLVCMVCHILTFWVRFIELEVFPHDAFAFLLYYQDNSVLGAAPSGLNDNYTIGMMQLVAYPAIIMISISAWFRHGKGNTWEYFKYLHYVFLVLVPAALLHANGSWYFLLGGISFYLIDASIRFVGVVSPPARLLNIGVSEADSGFTLLTFDRRHAEPGQFAWIRVPMISDWEWHPFSISSAPSDGQIKMCIKNMGPGTWTERLFTLARDAEGSEDPWPVQLDGPYGPPLQPLLADHKGVLLLAGGIGITQPHSVFRELAAYFQENKALPGGLKFVKLVWVAQSDQVFDLFHSSISDCLTGIPDSIMAAEFYSTKPSKGTSTGILVKEGRPDFRELYEAGGKALADDETLFVQACGPARMVDDAASVACEFPSVSFDSALFML